MCGFDGSSRISLAFWGGVRGIILGVVLLRARTRAVFWAIATVFGALAPTLVAGLVVLPLKGQRIEPSAKLLRPRRFTN